MGGNEKSYLVEPYFCAVRSSRGCAIRLRLKFSCLRGASNLVQWETHPAVGMTSGGADGGGQSLHANLVYATRRAARTAQHLRTHPQRQVDARVVAAVLALGQTLALKHSDIENTRRLSCRKRASHHAESAPKPGAEMTERRAERPRPTRGPHAYRCDHIALAVLVQGNHVRHRRGRNYRLAPPV